MHSLIAELLVGGRPVFGACDHIPGELVPLGSCGRELISRKPDHNEEERSELNHDGQASCWVGPTGNSGACT